MSSIFPPAPADKEELESSGAFTPKFDADGLVTAVVTDIKDGELLMVAHMNAQALSLTLETGIAHYYSRSRDKIWKKGETSGNLQSVRELRTDCDQDAIWLKVSVAGHDATCHTGRRSCFYRTLTLENGQAITTITDDKRHFDPAETYGTTSGQTGPKN
ncbi:phosphoribosyl-AMP cyclohydrolase [Agrobacterium vaccinii]|uniref:phosphoribosyl-AMP cyclohydrolase n=1 Tax=Agrobacterium vaccinii TaxID=2735528 RepID=UPI001E2AF8B2|nr:phosphoribosyl-AMP cyclohydrolase [Agrobacterium vaccinii]UHS56893.1 phosphoribosyl-AMP cyclohydrolase [Agrobacterium vaccinii]